MRVRRLIGVGVVTASAVLAAGPAYAAGNGGWQPETYGPVTQPAGQVCAFTLQVDVVRQAVRYRTTSTFPDGSPQTQQFVGPLILRYTNGSTGRSAIGNATGEADITYYPDGSQRWVVHGAVDVTFPVGNPYYPAGEYIVRGDSVLVLHPDTGAEIVSHSGPPIRDMCSAVS